VGKIISVRVPAASSDDGRGLRYSPSGSRCSAARASPLAPGSPIGRLVQALAIYPVISCAINFTSVLVQCGIGECHSFSDRFHDFASSMILHRNAVLRFIVAESSHLYRGTARLMNIC